MMVFNPIQSLPRLKHTSHALLPKHLPIHHQQTNPSSEYTKLLKGTVSSETLQALAHITEHGISLGGGSEGQVYLLGPDLAKNIPKCVVKVPHQSPVGKNGRTQFIGHDFSKEADIISKIPTHLGSAMKFLGLIQRPEGKMLVTTFADGKPLDPIKNPLNQQQLNHLLAFLYKLDSVGIYHSDLHEHNILYTPTHANVIDYGEAFFFSPEEQKARFNPARNIFTPPFALLSNALNFQTKGLPLYLEQLLKASPKEHGKLRTIFKEFLILKSTHQKDYLAQLKPQHFPKSFIFDELETRFLSNPSEEMIDLEAWKMQAMYCFAMAGRSTDFFKRPLEGLLWRFHGIFSAQKMLEKTKQMLKEVPPSQADLKIFLDFQKQYAQFLRREGLRFDPSSKKHWSDTSSTSLPSIQLAKVLTQK